MDGSETSHDECGYQPAGTGAVTLHLPWLIAVRVDLDRDGVVEHRVSALHDDGCVDVFVSGTHEAIAAIAAEVVTLRRQGTDATG